MAGPQREPLVGGQYLAVLSIFGALARDATDPLRRPLEHLQVPKTQVLQCYEGHQDPRDALDEPSRRALGVAKEVGGESGGELTAPTAEEQGEIVEQRMILAAGSVEAEMGELG